MEAIITIGRRKTSIARLNLSVGKGKITINKRELNEYFPSDLMQTIVKQPLTLVSENGKNELTINVKGGGMKGQAEAIRLAIARALCEVSEDYRPTLKKEGFLTRDPRMVERKKFGRKKARKKFQFSKR